MLISTCGSNDQIHLDELASITDDTEDKIFVNEVRPKSSYIHLV